MSIYLNLKEQSFGKILFEDTFCLIFCVKMKKICIMLWSTIVITNMKGDLKWGSKGWSGYEEIWMWKLKFKILTKFYTKIFIYLQHPQQLKILAIPKFQESQNYSTKVFSKKKYSYHQFIGKHYHHKHKTAKILWQQLESQSENFRLYM